MNSAGVSFDITDEQRELQAMAREFARREIRPIAPEVDEADGEMRWDLLHKAAALGLTSYMIPAEYGGGGITESLLRLLQPFDCHVTVVRNRVQPMDGADDVLEADRYYDALPGADAVFLALALTPETIGIISADELSLMERHAWLINVARGAHVVTDDLVVAL